MKHKTGELTGPLLDAAVALAEGWSIWRNKREGITINPPGGASQEHGNYPPKFDSETGARLGTIGAAQAMTLHGGFSPSVDWADGGPIIDRERISTVQQFNDPNLWIAGLRFWLDTGFEGQTGEGQTPLIAAMRAYVASKLGHEVELP